MKFKSFIKKMSKSRKYKNTSKMTFVEDVLREIKMSKWGNPNLKPVNNYTSWDQLHCHLLRMNACKEAMVAAKEVWNDFIEQNPQPVDGISPKDIAAIQKALRQVWSWSHPRKLCLARALNSDGFSVCEKCKKIAPKVFADHITPVGIFDAGYIERLFCPSFKLQALCKKCHDAKTYVDNGNLDFR